MTKEEWANLKPGDKIKHYLENDCTYVISIKDSKWLVYNDEDRYVYIQRLDGSQDGLHRYLNTPHQEYSIEYLAPIDENTCGEIMLDDHALTPSTTSTQEDFCNCSKSNLQLKRFDTFEYMYCTDCKKEKQ